MPCQLVLLVLLSSLQPGRLKEEGIDSRQVCAHAIHCCSSLTVSDMFWNINSISCGTGREPKSIASWMRDWSSLVTVAVEAAMYVLSTILMVSPDSSRVSDEDTMPLATAVSLNKASPSSSLSSSLSSSSSSSMCVGVGGGVGMPMPR